MRHGVKGRHLGRTAEHRRALFRNLVTALFEHGRIRTTDARAREIRPIAEKLITLGKRGNLHARRQAVRFVARGPALDRLFGPVAERFAERPGGYTRVIKAGRRHGDGAPIAYLELLDEAPRPVRASAPEERGKGGKSKEAAGRPKAPEAAGGPKSGKRARGRRGEESEGEPRVATPAKKGAKSQAKVRGEASGGKAGAADAEKPEAPSEESKSSPRRKFRIGKKRREGT